jgi:hypothetical protein
MSGIEQITTSLRSARTRALLPRVLVSAVLVVLCVAGLRAILAGTDERAPAATPPPPPVDLGAQGFAEGFVRSYLSWGSQTADEREHELAAYLPKSLDADGGLEPAEGTDQNVLWTTVTGVVREGRRSTVFVLADTSNGQIHLAVPVQRDSHGFLFIADYPALLGAPPIQRDIQGEKGDEVEDRGLTTVVDRALTNYLAGAGENLRADLTPDAVVSMPAQHLRLVQAKQATWLVAGSSVELIVEATDASQDTWTLHYDVEVQKTDRWYVRSIQHDPTSKEDIR